MMNVLQAYNLRIGRDEAKAILINWISGHKAVLRLCQPIKGFREGNIITINFNTLEIELYMEAA